MSEKRVSELDREIGNILNSDMSDDEKAKRYVSALRMQKFYSAVQPKPKDPEAEILKEVDPTQRTRAKDLLDKLKPYLSWNENNEIVANERVVPYSNVSHLLNDMIQPTYEDDPVGIDDFAQVINRARVPLSVIQNSRRREQLKQARKRSQRKHQREAKEQKNLLQSAKKDITPIGFSLDDTVWEEA